MRTHYCGELSGALVDRVVTLCGWAHRRRDHGGVIFIDLRDREGLAQVVFDPDRAEAFGIAERVRNEFVLQVTGKVRRRPAGTVNPDLRSGEVEVLAHEVEILNPSTSLPFQIDEENLNETTRLTHRVLDLRRDVMQKNLRLRYRTAMAVRNYLDAHGFIELVANPRASVDVMLANHAQADLAVAPWRAEDEAGAPVVVDADVLRPDVGAGAASESDHLRDAVLGEDVDPLVVSRQDGHAPRREGGRQLRLGPSDCFDAPEHLE